MDKLQAFNCPNCGSPLPVVDVRALVTCDYCDSHVQIRPEDKGGSFTQVVELPVVELISEQYLAGRIEKSLPGIFENLSRSYFALTSRHKAYLDTNINLIENITKARHYHAKGDMGSYKYYRRKVDVMIKGQTEWFKEHKVEPDVVKYLENRDKWLRNISRLQLANTTMELLINALKGRRGGEPLDVFDLLVEQGGMLATDFEDNHGVGHIFKVIFEKTLNLEGVFAGLNCEYRFEHIATDLDDFLKYLEPSFCSRYLGHDLQNSPFLGPVIVRRFGSLAEAQAELDRLRKYNFNYQKYGEWFWFDGVKDMIDRYVQIKPTSLITS